MSKNNTVETALCSHIMDPRARISVHAWPERPSKENPRPDVLAYGCEVLADGTLGEERAYDVDELVEVAC